MKEKNMYKYKVYGMNIESELILPELLTNNEEDYKKPDVIVSYGVMPEEISQEIQQGKWFDFKNDKMWFSIEDVAKYYIYNGDYIIVEPYNNENNRDVKAFLLGSAFGMVLLQKKIVAIHGGTVLIEDKGVIITGDRGAGKSTLTSGFREKGYRFLADDVSVAGKGIDTKAIIHPGYPQQKLCRDAMEKMGYNIHDFKRIDEGRDKYAIPVHNSFFKKAMPIGAICEITIGDSANVEIEEIIGAEKLKLLLRNIYRIEVTDYSGMYPDYFKKCVDIAKGVSFYRIKRPKDKFSVEDQISVIENTLFHRSKNVI